MKRLARLSLRLTLLFAVLTTAAWGDGQRYRLAADQQKAG